ncbi:uracil-DNA glycosylase [Halobacteriales archaeon QS_8_69_26]|nr:MAG: uracil-DNA glycosylase [Halobacteriales archaeon QS_8_69_26]
MPGDPPSPDSRDPPSRDAGDPPFPDPDDRLVLEPGCERCPALAECRERISWGVGPTDADVVVVGEAPGAGDPDADHWRGGNWTGTAYTSRHSGRRIRTTMRRAGHPDAYYTNAVKCFPADGSGSNREPTPTERARCRDHLVAELDHVDPDAVVPTGKHATLSVLSAAGRDLSGFLDSVLDPVECPDLGVTVLPLVHPSYREVWIGRLGYDYEEYVVTLGERLDAILGN